MEEEKIIPIDTRTKWSGWGMVAGIVIGMALTGSMAAAVYFYTKTKQQEQVLPLPSPTTIPTVRPQPTQEDMGVRWVSPPVEISKLDIFRAKDDRPDVPDYITDGAKFYKVAELDNGATLIDVTIQYGMMDSVVRLIERKDMTYEYLAAYLDKGVEEDSKRALKPGVTASNRRFDGLETPEELTMEEKTYKKGFLSYISFESLKNPVAMTDNLYRVETKILDSNQIFARVIYLRLKDGVVVPYSLKNTAYPDDQKPYLEWTDGASGNKMAFRQAVTVSCSAGMGSSVPIIKEGSPLLTGKVEVGKWQGQTIYQIKDPGNGLVKKLYDSYKVGRDYPSAAPVVSIEEFVNQKSHFLWKDQLGDWQIFVNQDFSSLAECGKPVIYLYPEEKTEVMVAVGAEINKSEPRYPEGGWKVMAYPNGKLIHRGNEYDSLFWEGLGNGVYPDLRNEGTMVRQGDMIKVLNQQLRQLGLNNKEATDFMEFWQERLPDDPWVRLTWFGTREMDMLAPLTVKPEPDSRIRIFLEFEGMDHPKQLKPQRLNSIERNGFTLVEWGGLLIGK